MNNVIDEFRQTIVKTLGYTPDYILDDVATSLNRIPKKKPPRKALTTPAAPAASAVDRLMRTDAQDARASELPVAQPCDSQQHRQSTT